MLPFALIFVIMYFLILRPQQKRVKDHAELIKNVRRGDTIITSGGIIGEVVHLKDNEVTIRSGDAKFVVLRSNIATVRNREEVVKPA